MLREPFGFTHNIKGQAVRITTAFLLHGRKLPLKCLRCESIFKVAHYRILGWGGYEVYHAAEDVANRALMLNVTLAIVGGIAGIGLYFLPSFIGSKKRNANAIVMLNLFLGWTFIGWVVALVWATTVDEPQRS